MPKQRQNEPRHEKPAFCICENKDADQLRGNREADQRLFFATQIVQFLYFLNPNFKASSHFLWQYSPVCVGPCRKPRRPVFSERGSNERGYKHVTTMPLQSAEKRPEVESASTEKAVQRANNHYDWTKNCKLVINSPIWDALSPEQCTLLRKPVRHLAGFAEMFVLFLFM